MEISKLSVAGIAGAGAGCMTGIVLAGLTGGFAGLATGALLGSTTAYLWPVTQLPDIPGEHFDRRRMHYAEAVDDEMIQSHHHE
ncbi:hypothetical protein [Parendozoicomonas sp. Alg238-R29]|uniref:hypothetical protein n=1 Tax=Parendozoicomonas sp. Alg238-R29 TaxID=2993446 RepID=UPI00248EA49A|nr:hypothetical protein [Parendozoicomonas sp. Alg238-R29]